MNANKSLIVAGLGMALVFSAAGALAVQGVDASGNSKINNAMAKKWKDSSGSGDAYNNPTDQKRAVNIGNRKSGNCTVNVGTARPGEKAPKEIVVTTKEVINVCK